MIQIEQVDTANKAQVKRFIDLPFRLYANCAQWVPPFRSDISLMLNRDKHPYYEHSAADFFIARQDGRDVGRIAALDNRPFNAYHNAHNARFYLFECEDNQEAASALFNRAFEWAKGHGLDTIVGPEGFGPLDGYGILIEGYQYRQMMNMMNYNFEYYRRMVETLGFEKEVDFVSHFADMDTFKFPERIHRIADRVRKRGQLQVLRFKNKSHMKSYGKQVAKAYNQAFIRNWEYYPLTEREVTFVVDNILLVADPKLIKLITHHDDMVGFLFAFQDVSAAMQRVKGKLFPFGILDLLQELRRTEWVSFNGVGILPEFHGIGGNALMYSEMDRSVTDFNFRYAEFTQVAETARTMRSDLESLGGKAYKNHRVYTRKI